MWVRARSGPCSVDDVGHRDNAPAGPGDLPQGQAARGRRNAATVAIAGLLVALLGASGCAQRGDRRFPALPDATSPDARPTEFVPDGGDATPDASPTPDGASG